MEAPLWGEAMKPIGPCKHCGSPAKGNPCWGLPADPNFDPPCYDDFYQDTINENRRSNMRFALGVLIAGVLACIAMLFAIGKARAHDGYPFECCDQRHCKPIDAPARRGAHWVLPDGRRFLAGTTRNSSEIGKRGFHLCDWNAGDYVGPNYEPTTIVQPKGRPVCLFVPDAEH